MARRQNPFVKTLTVLFSPLAYAVSYLVPKSRRKVAVGAWLGEMFADNPKYLYLHLAQTGRFDVAWIGDKALSSKVPRFAHARFLRRGSFAAVWFLMRSSTWVCCNSVDDLSSLALHARTRIVNLWHGIPLKLMGKTTPASKKRGRRKLTPLQKLANIPRLFVPDPVEYFASSSSGMMRIMQESYPARFRRGRGLPYGSPRIDFLVKHADDSGLSRRLKEKYASLCGFDPSRRIVLYTPTWRFAADVEQFSFLKLDTDRSARLAAVLGRHGAVLVEKQHFKVISGDNATACGGAVVQVGARAQGAIDVQELLLAADALVTDYSSIYFDYSVLRRPCCHFVYDYDNYVSSDSGLAYDMRQVAGGPLVEDFDALLAWLNGAFSNPRFNPAPYMHELLACENGDACAQYENFILR